MTVALRRPAGPRAPRSARSGARTCPTGLMPDPRSWMAKPRRIPVPRRLASVLARRCGIWRISCCRRGCGRARREPLPDSGCDPDRCHLTAVAAGAIHVPPSGLVAAEPGTRPAALLTVPIRYGCRRYPPVAARYISLLLVAVISIHNGTSAVLLDTRLIRGTAGDQAGPLLASAGPPSISPTSSRSGSGTGSSTAAARSTGPRRQPLPRLPVPADGPAPSGAARTGYRSSPTTCTSASPTPRRSPRPTRCPSPAGPKLLMSVQTAIALSTTALVIARAVNILK